MFNKRLEKARLLLTLTFKTPVAPFLVQERPERGSSGTAETAVAARIEAAMIEENILMKRELVEIVKTFDFASFIALFSSLARIRRRRMNAFGEPTLWRWTISSLQD